MIGCNPNVGCTPLDHGQNGSQDTTYCADFLAVHICRSRHGEKVPEQFICPVNQVHIHAAPISFLPAMLYDPASALGRLFPRDGASGNYRPMCLPQSARPLCAEQPRPRTGAIGTCRKSSVLTGAWAENHG